jgi:hypothetical protein
MTRTKLIRTSATSIGLLLACLALTACGRTSLSGTYLPKGGGLGNGLVMEKMEFGSGGNVTLTMMQQHIRVPYKIDGKQLLLSANGQEMVFEIDSDGCLDGGGVFGKFCKG